jgi:hypothetical protein
MPRIFQVAAMLFLAGCSVTPARDLATNDPASPHAVESQSQKTSVLSIDTAPATATLYTCPMHPQIVSDHPGKCPICRMALEPKVGGK